MSGMGISGRHRKSAVSPMIATTLLVVIAVIIAGMTYTMVANYGGGKSQPFGAFTDVERMEGSENTYRLTVGPSSQKILLSDVKVNIFDQVTTSSLMNYIGPTHKWIGSGVTMFVVDLANDGDLDNGDYLVVGFPGLIGDVDVDANIIYTPAGSVLASATFFAQGVIDPALKMFYDFSSSFVDKAGKLPDAKPRTGWTGPYFSSVGGVGVLDLSSNSVTLKKYAQVADNPILKPTKRISVEVRVMLDKTPASEETSATAISKGNSWSIQLSGGSGATKNQYFQFSIRLGTSNYNVNSITKPQQGVWYTVTGTYDQITGQISIYVNGIKEKTTTVATKPLIATNTNVVNIGYLSGNRYWSGPIDYVKMSGI